MMLVSYSSHLGQVLFKAQEGVFRSQGGSLTTKAAQLGQKSQKPPKNLLWQ